MKTEESNVVRAVGKWLNDNHYRFEIKEPSWRPPTDFVFNDVVYIKSPQGREEEVKEVDWLCMKDRMDEAKCEVQCEKCSLDTLKSKWFEVCVHHRDEFRKWVKTHMTDSSDQVDSDWDLLQKGIELLGLPALHHLPPRSRNSRKRRKH